MSESERDQVLEFERRVVEIAANALQVALADHDPEVHGCRTCTDALRYLADQLARGIARRDDLAARQAGEDSTPSG